MVGAPTSLHRIRGRTGREAARISENRGRPAVINIGRYRFEGPAYVKAAIKDAAGVYAVLDDRGNDGIFVLDVGESGRIRTRIESHDREFCWQRNRRGRICYAAVYMPGSPSERRRAVEEELRRLFSPACGVR